jgi:hypothetical protein
MGTVWKYVSDEALAARRVEYPCPVCGTKENVYPIYAKVTVPGAKQPVPISEACLNCIRRMPLGEIYEWDTERDVADYLRSYAPDLPSEELERRREVNRVRLLHGPYRAPRLRKGDRASCLFRDCDVVVTGWTDARISWPRCRPLDVPRSHPSLLADDELARAVRQESAAAVRYWWGVSVGVVWRWRKALGVTRTNNEGSRRRMRAAAEAGPPVCRPWVRARRITPPIRFPGCVPHS